MRSTKTQCESSIRARATALKSLIDGEQPIDRSLVKACRSAVAFQRYRHKKLGITPFGSRNTLVKYANSVLGNEVDNKTGWQYLNDLRQAVHIKFRNTLSPRSAAEVHRRDMATVRDLTQRLDQSERMLLSQSKAYMWLLQEINGLARSRRFSKDVRESLYIVLKSHADTFGHLFDPDARSRDDADNVVGIRDR
ncbi:MAG: hypothetical protein AAGI27_04335 [Pseudomonadota bacterium]